MSPLCCACWLEQQLDDVTSRPPIRNNSLAGRRFRKMSGKRCFELLMAGALLSAANIGAAADDQQADCHVGTYRFANRPDVDIGPGAEGKLRWRRQDGTTGELTRASDGSWTST